MSEFNKWYSSSFPYMLADGGKTLIRVDAVEAITESSDGGSIISLSGMKYLTTEKDRATVDASKERIYSCEYRTEGVLYRIYG